MLSYSNVSVDGALLRVAKKQTFQMAWLSDMDILEQRN